MVLFKMGNSKVSFDKPEVPNDYFLDDAKYHPLKHSKEHYFTLSYFRLVVIPKAGLDSRTIDYSRFWIRGPIWSPIHKKLLLVAIERFRYVKLWLYHLKPFRFNYAKLLLFY